MAHHFWEMDKIKVPIYRFFDDNPNVLKEVYKQDVNEVFRAIQTVRSIALQSYSTRILSFLNIETRRFVRPGAGWKKPSENQVVAETGRYGDTLEAFHCDKCSYASGSISELNVHHYLKHGKKEELEMGLSKESVESLTEGLTVFAESFRRIHPYLNKLLPAFECDAFWKKTISKFIDCLETLYKYDMKLLAMTVSSCGEDVEMVHSGKEDEQSDEVDLENIAEHIFLLTERYDQIRPNLKDLLFILKSFDYYEKYTTDIMKAFGNLGNVFHTPIALHVLKYLGKNVKRFKYSVSRFEIRQTPNQNGTPNQKSSLAVGQTPTSCDQCQFKSLNINTLNTHFYFCHCKNENGVGKML
ncbi:C2H2-type domain-containing protein [Caenorhabditis elegans]|uniref:C2H2-type domain-containing protein n=1 Tax=Caenorhabditis elegans TaxID=6239 RepID=Q9NEN9_CAEEL|nr:C2H2-type domain-containing protein [Caenorhabditis elegans]CAB81993.2 C2H2-type domain-containing protein [Caenorhabditis elegans]